MYITRILSITVGSLRIQDYAEDKQKNMPRMVLLAGENFNNQFELPVLFFILMTLLQLQGNGDQIFVSLAWSFVVFRFLHSIIHCSYNNVLHRLISYWLGAACLWAMWLVFGWSVI